MKNITSQKPSDELLGRLAYTVGWVSDEDIRNKRILDIGCGYGWFEYNALQRGVREVVGLEQSEKDLETVRQHIVDDRAKFCVGNALEIPFVSESFDTVVSWEVIEHIPKNTESLMLEEIYRVLRPGGVCYLSTPHASAAANATDPAWWIAGHRHYKKENLQRLAESRGFQTDELFATAGYWTVLASLDMYFAKWILRRGPMLKSVTAQKEKKDFGKGMGFVNLFGKFRKA